MGLIGGFAHGNDLCCTSSRPEMPNISQCSESSMRSTFDCELEDAYLSFQYLVLSLPGIYTQLFSKTVMLQDIYPL